MKLSPGRFLRYNSCPFFHLHLWPLLSLGHGFQVFQLTLKRWYFAKFSLPLFFSHCICSPWVVPFTLSMSTNTVDKEQIYSSNPDVFQGTWLHQMPFALVYLLTQGSPWAPQDHSGLFITFPKLLLFQSMEALPCLIQKTGIMLETFLCPLLPYNRSPSPAVLPSLPAEGLWALSDATRCTVPGASDPRH